MEAQINKWGNSLGIRIPKAFTEKQSLSKGSKVNLTIEDGKLIIEPIGDPRENWDAMFKEAISKGQEPESDIWENMANEEDDTQWTW